MVEGLVSIVTPCYNGSKYLNGYFHDLLKQDYDKCELIFIDDGSNDNSKEIVESYRKALAKKGIELYYFYQENAGSAAAVYKGLQYVKGEYLIWPDCDDHMPPNSISKKVEFLKNNHQYGIVRTNGVVVDEVEPEKIIRYFTNCKKEKIHEEIFEDYLLGINAWLMPGSFMVRVSSFLTANPDRYIDVSGYGQNWQMVLPVFYYFPCGYIDEPLFVYVLHKGSISDSRGKSYTQLLSRQQNYYKTIINTIDHMNIADADKYKNMVEVYYLKKYLTTAFIANEKKDAMRFYRMICQKNGFSFKCWVKAHFTGVKFLKHIYYYLIGKQA